MVASALGRCAHWAAGSVILRRSAMASMVSDDEGVMGFV